MTRTAVLIPSYCSWANLEANLPALLTETRRLGVPVTVTDDASPDDTLERLQAAFPEVQLLRRPANGGFGENCNSGVEALDADLVFLMNADVEVLPGFLEPLIEALEANSEAFAVSSVALSPDRAEILDGPRWGTFRRGHLKWDKLDHAPLLIAAEPVPTLYAVGAHVLVRRERFLALGGFDPLFAPYYWEDVDLCYRAWKHGWSVLCHPLSPRHPPPRPGLGHRAHPRRRPGRDHDPPQPLPVHLEEPATTAACCSRAISSRSACASASAG